MNQNQNQPNGDDESTPIPGTARPDEEEIVSATALLRALADGQRRLARAVAQAAADAKAARAGVSDLSWQIGKLAANDSRQDEILRRVAQTEGAEAGARAGGGRAARYAAAVSAVAALLLELVRQLGYLPPPPAPPPAPSSSQLLLHR